MKGLKFSVICIFLLLLATNIAKSEGVWQPLQLQISNRTLVFQDIQFVDAQNGWGIGESGFEILHTTDGGKKWTIQSVSPGSTGGHLRSICYGGKKNLWQEVIWINNMQPDGMDEIAQVLLCQAEHISTP